MAGSKSDYLEAKLLDLVLGGVAYTPPSVVYVALYITIPSELIPGTEPSGGGYARVAVNNDLVNWPAATGTTTKANGTVFTFPAATSAWGDILGIGIFDDPTAGNLLYWAQITTVTVGLADVVRILPGGITVTSN